MKKRILVLLLLLTITLTIVGAKNMAKIYIAEEIGRVKYNRIGRDDFSTITFTSNVSLTFNYIINMGNNYGIEIENSLGYRVPLYDYCLFSSIPSHINGSIGLGLNRSFSNFDLSISALLRSSYFSNRKTFLSEMGLEIKGSWYFGRNVFLLGSVALLWGYDIQSINGLIALGYTWR